MSRPRLWKEIVILLTIKAALLTCLFLAFFSPSHRPAHDTAAVTDRLLGTVNR